LRAFFQGHTRDEQVESQYLILYAYKILRLLLIDFIITYFLGVLMYIVSNELNPKDASMTFIEAFKLRELSEYDRVVVCMYFILTTITTVGYGDFYPMSAIERVYVIGVQLFGVAFYSYIMGNFIEIISNYDKKMGIVDKGSELQNWLTLLTRFTNNKPLNNEIVSEIEDHFKYFWSQYKLASIASNDPYITRLPKRIRRKVSFGCHLPLANRQLSFLRHLL
jgi:hypothetical protein